MPTSTNVTNLKINELTEAQYDAAVQGGTIGANELSVITDMDIDAIQVSSLPTAAAGEVGKVYQFIGTTDVNYTHGYFYECVSDGGNPATYSWSQLNVQPAGSSLPSQTGNSGKFLTTNGTNASWANALTNKAGASNSLAIIGTVDTLNNPDKSMAIGSGATVWGYENIAIGYNAQARSVMGKTDNVAIGNYAVAGGNSGQPSVEYATAIGDVAQATANYAIQLGKGANSTANTFSVGIGANKNYRLLDSDGTIPHARLTNAVVSNSITIAVADWNGGTTCSKTVSGLTATSVVWVAPDNASQSDYLTAGVYASAQTTDTITFTCSTTPTSALTVNVIYC